MRKAIMLTAAAATASMSMVVAPSAALANGYGQRSALPLECQQSTNNRGLAAGLAGAAVGVAAGRSLAGRGNRTEGGILGALAGAVIGNQIGRRNVACSGVRGSDYQSSGYQGSGYSQSGYQHSGYNAPRHTGYQSGYQSGYQGHAVAYQPPQPACGWGETTVRGPDGRVFNQQVYMCQANDGQWYPANN